MIRCADVRRTGERGILVEFDALEQVSAFHARAAADPLPGQVDQVAAARTVLLTFRSALHARNAASLVRRIDTAPIARPDARTVDIDVVYDGDDLEAVAAHTGLSRDAVVAAHTAGEWTAAFGGFAPGFAYLAGGDARLHVPRRTSPRTTVPAGSVALAGEFSAVYPRSSPGGWQLIGRSAAPMWDLDRERPALVAPGDRVRFRAVRALATGSAAPARGEPAETPAPRRIARVAERPIAPIPGDPALAPARLEVVAPGLRSLVQDLGRAGHADLGVPASGAADRDSARAANAAVGNPADAAVIESLLGGLTVAARGDVVIALAGALAPARVDDEIPVGAGAPFLLRDGEILTVGAPVDGLRTYLAVRGGIDVPPVLCSRSADTLSGIGPAPLAAGDALPVGDPPRAAVGAPAAVRDDDGGDIVLHAIAGPRDDWFADGELARLARVTWVVGSDSDRVGVRLAPSDGARPLERRDDRELPSEGVVAGSLQVPPTGEPVLFLADHPVTGGYPVIAVVAEDAVSRAAQLRPGRRVRFEIIG